MSTKYDTNPLDPDFPERVKAEAEAETATRALPYAGGKTRKFAGSTPTEEQTLRFASPDLNQYSSPYDGQFTPTNYQPVSFGNVDQSISRRVSKVGLPENIMTAVPYIPFYLGMVAGILILLFLPKSEAKVRFHAAQGLAAHVAILVVSTLLGILSQVTDFADFGSGIFSIVAMVMLIFSAFKAWKGRPVHIETVEELTNWLEEKIGPVKT